MVRLEKIDLKTVKIISLLTHTYNWNFLDSMDIRRSNGKTRLNLLNPNLNTFFYNSNINLLYLNKVLQKCIKNITF